MNENIIQYWNRVKQYWDQFSKTQKITFFATAAIILLTIGIVTYNLSKTEYSLAYTDLQPSDAAAIKDYLEDAGIPYKLSTDGKSIGVPANRVAKIKLDVESQNLNKSGSIGYEAFSGSSSFGMTDNEFKVKYVNAVQGELQQLIRSINGVESAKVMVTFPEESVFLNDKNKEQSQASVVVHLKRGYTLDQSQVDTIYNLVSHSVKNLPLENITISDQNGNFLPSSKSNDALGTASNLAQQQFLIKKQFEADIQGNVQQLLGRVLGPENVIVSVVSAFNFDKMNSHQQLVTPVNTVDQKGIEISLQEIQKSYSSEGGAADGGVSGTGTTDVPTYQGLAGGSSTNSEEESRTINYEVNRITNEIVSNPYSVRDMTINVGIEPPTTDPESLTQETKDAIQGMLVNIVRASLADSDQTLTDEELTKKVTVFAHTFANSNLQATNAPNYLLYVSIGAAAMALVVAGGYLVSRRRRKREMMEREAAIVEKAEEELLDLGNINNDSQIRKELGSLARTKPDSFVGLLRTWLADE